MYNYNYFWEGQIVSDEETKKNQPPALWKSPDDQSGWGAGRVRVRIKGKHTEDKNLYPDVHLPWAELAFPVTAGSGLGACSQSPALRKGTFVFGFYKDFPENTQPVIIGCSGINDQTVLFKNPKSGFVPFSAFDSDVPYYSIPINLGKPFEGINATTTSFNSVASDGQKEDGQKKNNISSSCDKQKLSGISLTIKNLKRDIEKVKKDAKKWKNTVTKPITYKGKQMSVSEYTQMKIDNAAKDISKFIKSIINEIRKKVKEKVNNALKDTYYFLFPNQRPEFQKKVETVNDLIGCLFNKIVSNLFKMIGKFLTDILDRFINVAECLIGNLLGGLLGKILGLINSLLKTIEAIIGFPFDILDAILEFIEDLVDFLSCDENPECAEIKEWSIWDGAGKNTSIKLDFSSIINKANELASTGTKLLDFDNLDDTLSLNDLFSNSCFTGPLFCGPPTIEFYGGGGSGAVGNAIIGSLGEILGIDIISSGSGYIREPFVVAVDGCGKGSGAVLRGVVGPITETRTLIASDGTEYTETIQTTGVTQVIVEQSGIGYLPAPDGDQGGDERIWATRCQSTIQRSNGIWEDPYDPGEIMTIRIGDRVQLAGQSPYIAIQDETVTAPPCPPVTAFVGNPGSTSIGLTNLPVGNNFTDSGIQPSTSAAQYPVVLSLCDVEIRNPGVNYSKSDKIIVTPNNGAALEPIFDSLGSLEKINITSVGVGYTERPIITIETETGYNADIVPILCVNRLTGDIAREQLKDREGQVEIPLGEKIVSVVDCVGKIVP